MTTSPTNTNPINSSTNNSNLTPWQRRPTVGARKFGAKNFTFTHLAVHNRWIIKCADGFSYKVFTEIVRENGRLAIRASQEQWPVSQIVARVGESSPIVEAVPIGLSWARVDLRVKASKLNIKCG